MTVVCRSRATVAKSAQMSFFDNNLILVVIISCSGLGLLRSKFTVEAKTDHSESMSNSFQREVVTIKVA